MMSWIDVLSKIAPLVTACVAIVAVFMAWHQICVSRKTQLEVQTRALLKEYFQIGLSYPDLMHPSCESFNFESKSLYSEKKNFLRYEWIVSHALLMANNIFEKHINDDYWIGIAKNILRYHRYYFGWLINDNNSPNYLKDLCVPLKTYIQQEFKKFEPTAQTVTPCPN